MDSLLYIYHLFVWSNLNFLHNTQWITFPTQSCLVLYSFCANLQHSLIMWLFVSSLSSHNLHLLFCCILSIFTLTYLVLTALFCAVIRKDSVSLLRFSFLSNVQVFSCEISHIYHLKCSCSYFFQCLFSAYFCSVDAWVVCIISGRCNQSSSAMMHRRFLQCWWVLFLLLFCLRHKALNIIMIFLVLFFFCLNSSFTHFKNRPEYLTRRTA